MLFFSFLLSSGSHGLLHALKSTSVCLRSLSSRRKSSSMSYASVGLDILESLDIRTDFSLKVSLKLEALNYLSDLRLLVWIDILGSLAKFYASVSQDLVSSWSTNTVKRCKGDFKTFIFWDCDTEYTHWMG